MPSCPVVEKLHGRLHASGEKLIGQVAVRALGFDQVDLFGFSMGGMIAQVIAYEEPQLVRKMILAGTGPPGGEGIDKVTRIS
jgi:pimeloyl-ACP methyl ester carboxylesterase